jgi:hypothetical protein
VSAAPSTQPAGSGISISATTRPSGAVSFAGPSTQPASNGSNASDPNASVADKVAGWLWGGEKGAAMDVEADESDESTVTELPSDDAFGAESK